MKNIATDIYTFRDLREDGYGYADEHRRSGRRLTLLGLSFSSEKRAVVECLKEEVACG